MQTTATGINPLRTTQKSNIKPNGFKSARTEYADIPDSSLNELQNYNSHLKEEVVQTIDMIEEKLNQLKQRKTDVHQTKLKTVREKQQEDHSSTHQKQMLSRKKKYALLKKDVERIRKELGTYTNSYTSTIFESKFYSYSYIL